MSLVQKELDAPRKRQPREKPRSFYACNDLKSLKSLLSKYLQDASGSLIPEPVFFEVVLGADVALQIETPQGETKTITIMQAVYQRSSDAKERLRNQRAAAKAILKAIKEGDGYLYYEANSWETNSQDGFRLRYECSDSLSNKDRAANRKRSKKAGSDEQEQPGQNAADQKNKFALPTFDCKGKITFVFSKSQQQIRVTYKHLPIHRDVSTRSVQPKQNGTGAGAEALPPTPFNEGGKPSPKRRKRGSPSKTASTESSDHAGLGTLVQAVQADVDGRANGAPSASKPKHTRNTKEPSCSSCQRRRIKCDRNQPCGQCSKARGGPLSCEYLR